MEALRLAPSTDAPEPLPEAPAWFEHARCLDADPAMFFPEKGESPEAAIAVCEVCPVREVCLDYALEESVWGGVWGGTTDKHRRTLRRQPQAS